jgi:hypothetical protein
MTFRRISLPRSKSRPPQVGKGLAWLLFDAGGELFKYQCYWMGAHCDDHLIEHARTVTGVDAVAWAASRTPQARIPMPDHITYWAGRGPRPSGFSRSWQQSNPTAIPSQAVVLAPAIAAGR